MNNILIPSCKTWNFFLKTLDKSNTEISLFCSMTISSQGEHAEKESSTLSDDDDDDITDNQPINREDSDDEDALPVFLWKPPKHGLGDLGQWEAHTKVRKLVKKHDVKIKFYHLGNSVIVLGGPWLDPLHIKVL